MRSPWTKAAGVSRASIVENQRLMALDSTTKIAITKFWNRAHIQKNSGSLKEERRANSEASDYRANLIKVMAQRAVTAAG